MRRILSVLLTAALLAPPAGAWGVRGHRLINQVAIEELPEDGPAFLRQHVGWIAFRGSSPDWWRFPSEPHLKIDEDPNHGWFREQFAFLPNDRLPRSRHEFLLALYKEHVRLRDRNPEAAKLTNVRWTGTLPYAAMETYERLKSSFRLWRQTQNAEHRRYLEQDLAFYAGWLGHYTGDGAQPLHVTIHHDGWQGPNPKGYTRDPRVHGKYETAYVELLDIKADDFRPLVGPAKRLADPFAAVVAHLDDSFRHVETIYAMEKRGAFNDERDKEARQLTYERLAAGARLLRDLVYTAWRESEQPVRRRPEGTADPLSAQHPRYNPETGTAPPTP